jgi:hypothetical protein
MYFLLRICYGACYGVLIRGTEGPCTASGSIFILSCTRAVEGRPYTYGIVPTMAALGRRARLYGERAEPDHQHLQAARTDRER